MTQGFLYDYYRSLIFQLRRGNYRGAVSNAKPMYLYLLIVKIGAGEIEGNRIFFDKELIHDYRIAQNFFHCNKTPLSKPYYFLATDKFYHLKWRDEPIKNDSPSAKFIRDNIEYAYFDNALWDLLLDENVRKEYCSVLLQRYMIPHTLQQK